MNNNGDNNNQSLAALSDLEDRPATTYAGYSFAELAPAKPFLYDISEGHLEWIDCEILLRELLKFSEVKKLGRGCFGRVFSVIRTGRTQAEACKITNYIENKGDIFDQKEPVSKRYFNCSNRAFQEEVSLLRGVAHPHIIASHDTFQIYHNSDTLMCTIVDGAEWLGPSPNRTLLISGSMMEKAEISVDGWRQKYKIKMAGEAMLRAMFTQIGGAFAYLHSNFFICHEDIKEDNVVLYRDLGPTEVPVFKLIDFGISVKYNEDQYQAAQKSSSMYDIDGEPILEKYTEMVYGNPFIQEGNMFGTFLNEFSYYSRNPEIKDEKLKKVIAVLSPPAFGGLAIEKVTIEWALQKYAEADS